MDLNVLKTFIAVCEYGGFSAAGDKLGYSQSTVSSQIKQLEKELGVTLFDRIRHNTKTTRQGNIVLKYAREILDTNYTMMDALHKSEKISGEIRLAMADSVCAHYITDGYQTFHEKYPDIVLKITSGGTEQMFDMLRKNEVDIVFTLDNHIYDSEFTIMGEAVERTHFVASIHHPLVNKKVELKDIIHEKFFLTEGNMSYRSLLDLRLAYESLEIKPILELGDPGIICNILKECDAISFLPDFITEEYVKEGSLQYLNVEDCHITVWTQILMHKDKWHSPAMDAFINYYKEILEKGH